MAEMVGLSRNLRRQHGVVGGLVAALKARLARFSGRRAKPLHFEEWPDYLLRDIGINRAELEPHGHPAEWLRR